MTAQLGVPQKKNSAHSRVGREICLCVRGGGGGKLTITEHFNLPP